jgi:hypothetical protein
MVGEEEEDEGEGDNPEYFFYLPLFGEPSIFPAFYLGGSVDNHVMHLSYQRYTLPHWRPVTIQWCSLLHK